ncbi:hypothetical protein BSKO_07494 [Bryopsis sp. KO-2023]|nr:hypothetical protein BSKO_07494 [Bryopsis sp. KO-2023]
MSQLLEGCIAPNPRRRGSKRTERVAGMPRSGNVLSRAESTRHVYPMLPAGGLLTPSQAIANTRQVQTSFAPLDNGEFELDVTTGEFPATLELGDELGSGTFGVVRVVTCRVTGEKFAVKVLPKKHGALLNTNRIRNEVLAWRQLTECDNAVKFVDCYEDRTSIYLVQELCTGGNLRDLFMARPNRSLDEIEVAQVAWSILRIVAFCHKKSMCYGDVKPENFVLKWPYDHRSWSPKEPLLVKAVDFGSAKMNAKEGSLRGENGSPLYRAPEAHYGAYGVEVDIWSVGVLMYHLLCGAPPFVHRVIQGEWEWSWRMSQKLHPDGLGYAITAIPLDFYGEIWETISEGAKDLLSKMLDRDVQRRITAQNALQHPWILENSARLEISYANQRLNR